MIAFLLACKEKRVSEFEYTLDQGKVCAIKPNEINTANGFGRLDSSFKYKIDSFDEQLSIDIYKETIENLPNKNINYIFCFDKSRTRANFLETRIMVEIKKGEYMRQYEFLNYSCLSKDKMDLNLSNNQAIKKCG